VRRVRLRPPGGRPYPPGYLTRRFAKLVRREGLPPIRLHDLRHGAATLALAGGADLKVIQAMLGHASIILTADTYTSVLPDLARATAEAVAAQILKAARTPPASPRPHPGLTRRRHDHPQGCVTAGQGPWGARGSNPEPTD
jgi:integrase-like protein